MEGRPTRPGAAGFTLIEVLISIVVMALVGIAAAAISLTGAVRFTDEGRERHVDATTAQWTAVAFARDVGGATGVAPAGQECSAGVVAGTDIVTLVEHDGSRVGYLWTHDASGYDLVRAECGAAAGGTSRVVVDDLAAAPTVSCFDDGDALQACDAGSTPPGPPRRLRLEVSRTADFEFDLDGVRRGSTGSSVGDPTLEAPSFLALGGDPLYVGGTSSLVIDGNAFINRPDSGAIAVSINGSGEKLRVEGDFRLQDGATCPDCGSGANKVPGTFDTKIPDPLRFLPAPDVSTLWTYSDCPKVGTVRVCEPGVYDVEFPPSVGGGGGVKDFELRPGIYVLRAGMKVNNGSVTVAGGSGGGVLLYNESGDVTVNGAALDLTPPSAGPYAGILLFQARDNTAEIRIGGNAELASLTGTIYAPASDGVELGAGGGVLHVGRVVGTSLSTSGTGTVMIHGS